MTDRAVPLSSLGLTARAGANPMITGIAVDSREVREGTLFAALPGSRVHGAAFIQYALRMGAAAARFGIKHRERLWLVNGRAVGDAD